jgi:membrane associated rhomboid family serine protease
MLADRDYMRSGGDFDPAPRRPMSATTLLLILNGLVFLLQAVIYGYPPDFRTGPPLALRVDQLLHGYVWQLLTYQFLHGGLLHVLLNCWGIYVFGKDVEEALGRKRFFILYFTSGVVGGLLQVLFSLGWHGHFGGSVVGASAGLFGLIGAFATMFPHRVLTLLLFFVIPVSLKARTLLLICGAIAIFGILFPGDHVAHAAHLGGMLAGLVFIRQLRFRWGFWPGEQPGPSQSRPRRGRATVIDVEQVDTDEFLAREVDSILDKINAKGIHSLTDRERRTLDEARKKMGRRP